jgi:hypothetical protein
MEPNLTDANLKKADLTEAVMPDTKSAYIVPLLPSVVETFRRNVSTKFRKYLKKGVANPDLV